MAAHNIGRCDRSVKRRGTNSRRSVSPEPVGTPRSVKSFCRIDAAIDGTNLTQDTRSGVSGAAVVSRGHREPLRSFAAGESVLISTPPLDNSSSHRKTDCQVCLSVGSAGKVMAVIRDCIEPVLMERNPRDITAIRPATEFAASLKLFRSCGR